MTNLGISFLRLRRLVRHNCPVEEFEFSRNAQLLQNLTGIPSFFDLNSSAPIFGRRARFCPREIMEYELWPNRLLAAEGLSAHL